MEIFLYVIILGLAIGLITSIISGLITQKDNKKKDNKKIINWILGVSIVICILLVIYHKDESSAKKTSYQTAIEDTIFQVRLQKILEKVLQKNPNQLIIIIKDQQRINVKESCGEFDYQCFTDRDLEKFKKDNIVDDLKVTLTRDNNFLEIVLAIKIMQPGERDSLLDTAARTCKPTWAQLGRISCEGQTEAGHTAELMIAQTIVELVKELYSLSEERIVRQMN